jgi:sterol desaturase/sphingolipid hydroxylase (fatty acid hydroxylase superfamily)
MFKKANRLIQKLFDFRATPLLAAGVAILFIMETRHELRRRKHSRWERLKTNGVVALSAAAGLRLVLLPGIVMAAQLVKIRKRGLLRLLALPRAARNLLAFLLLDYSNYRWHRLNHEWPLLWRFHQVHHADLDLDLSTALRFHVGEVMASALYRGAWVVALGASPRTVLLYEFFFEAANNFHHSNLNLPGSADRHLANFIVTPRMHGIHHSIVRSETDSNYSILFNFWDRLHSTLRLDVPQHQINIGVPYIREHLPASSLFTLPLAEVPEWKLPDGSVPERRL